MEREVSSIHKKPAGVIKIILTVVFSAAPFVFAPHYNTLFSRIMSVASFLTWHNMFELVSILASFSIFTVTFYTYEESENVRMIILGCSFLAMGMLDAFHTLSYKGMPDFFIPNTGANRATLLWVLSRATGSVGILSAVFVPSNVRSNVKKWYFAIPALIMTLILFFLATYYPGLFPAMFIDGKGLTFEKIMIEYLIILLMVITLLKVAFEFKETSFMHHYLFILGVFLCMLSEIAFVKYASVYDIYNYLGHIYKFAAYLVLFESIYTDNVTMPYREMKKARNELKDYSENLNSLVKQKTKELLNANEKLLMDLEYAKDIQRSLLPLKMPDDEKVLFRAGYIPAEHLSGDFYNVIKLDETNIAVYIGDVAGHGVSAAMLTVFANQNIRPVREMEDSIEIISPKHVLKTIYKAFNETSFMVETYIVMLYGIYNTESRCFTYASGGINVSPLLIKKSGEIIEMDTTGFAICKLGELVTPVFEDRLVQLEPGDNILFYTDGLIEVKNENGEKYIRDNLGDIIMRNVLFKRQGFADSIKQEFLNHILSGREVKDDVTFLIMEICS